MIIQQLSVFVENQAGRLTAIVKALGAKGVDISALSLADTTDFGIMRLIVDKPALAMETLREEGIICKLTDVLAVRMGNQPGGLAAVLTVLTKAEMSISYMYAFTSKEEGAAMMVLSVEQPQVVCDLLTGEGFTTGSVQ